MWLLGIAKKSLIAATTATNDALIARDTTAMAFAGWHVALLAHNVAAINAFVAVLGFFAHAAARGQRENHQCREQLISTHVGRPSRTTYLGTSRNCSHCQYHMMRRFVRNM